MKERRTKIGGQFAPRTIEMIRSPAMRVLSLSARRVLERLEVEMADHGGTENGRLPVTYADLVEWGIDRHAIAPAIRELVALGFIEVTERGRAGNAEYRTPSLYRLTFRHTKYAGPTDDWRQIETIEGAQALAIAARRASNKRAFSSGGKRHVSMGETHTEKAQGPVGETPITAPVGETHTTFDISGRVRGDAVSPLRDFLLVSTPAPKFDPARIREEEACSHA